MNKTQDLHVSEDVRAGAAIYNKPILSLYNLVVLTISNPFIWRCPTPTILAFYNQHVSDNHLDVGVGTGYFLHKCRFPAGKTPKITLLDLNPNTLEVTSQLLERYKPTKQLGNILEPVELEDRFDSIGINYLLHCLPGPISNKAAAFVNLKPLLKPGGVIFGTTILGQGTPQNFMAKRLMRLYNQKKVFSNTTDSQVELEKILRENFSQYMVQVRGCVAFFSAKV